MTGYVELRVSEHGEELLAYTFPTAGEAGEMIKFLTDFFPQARFLVQPVRH